MHAGAVMNPSACTAPLPSNLQQGALKIFLLQYRAGRSVTIDIWVFHWLQMEFMAPIGRCEECQNSEKLEEFGRFFGAQANSRGWWGEVSAVGGFATLLLLWE